MDPTTVDLVQVVLTMVIVVVLVVTTFIMGSTPTARVEITMESVVPTSFHATGQLLT